MKAFIYTIAAIRSGHVRPYANVIVAPDENAAVQVGNSLAAQNFPPGDGWMFVSPATCDLDLIATASMAGLKVSVPESSGDEIANTPADEVPAE